MKEKVGQSKAKGEKDTKQAEAAGTGKKAAKASIVIPRALTVRQLADTLSITVVEAIKHLMRNGTMATINQVIDFDIAALVISDLGYEAKEETDKSEITEEKYQISDEDIENQKPRPPVITILGHVDHGKTKLLDAIRESNVAEMEAGSITQHIGAYQVEIHGQKITFLDTPGHEAFTAMRARGAKVTDIAILVVAADDGVMPQTIEAIDHAKAADVPIVVAINKIDKPEANIDKVKQQLADNNILIEEWGGDVVSVPISAKRGDGIPELLENLLIVAEIQELKANPNRSAAGVVIEASLDSSKGTIATILVQAGTLKLGDSFVVGETYGKVKAMFNDKGKRVKKAEPSMPVEILGLNSVPRAGDTVMAVEKEKDSKAEAQRRQNERESTYHMRTPTLSNIYSKIQEGQVKELDIVLKTDVQGSLDPIRSSLERLSSEEVKVRIVRASTGNVTKDDVMLAIASNGIVVCFNTKPEPEAKLLAEAEGVDIRSYQIIYKLVEDIEKALTGLLEPVFVDVVEGHAEVRAIFNVRQGRIAGAYVTDGKLNRNSPARVLRNSEVLHESYISSLRHFKDNVKEVSTGFECGIGIDGFGAFEEGDIIEGYRKEKVS